MPSARPFTVSDGEGYTCTTAKTDRALAREIALGSDFLPASHVRPNFDILTGGQEDQTLRQEVKGT